MIFEEFKFPQITNGEKQFKWIISFEKMETKPAITTTAAVAVTATTPASASKTINEI